MRPTFLQKLFHKRLRNLFVTVRSIVGIPKACQPMRCCGGGAIRFGRNVQFGVAQSPYFTTTEAYIEARTPESIITIGDGTIVNNAASLIAVDRISIGRRCRIGTYFRCFDSDFHGLTIRDRDSPAAVYGRAVDMGDDVWIGDSATVLKGVRLGRGCVVGAGSVVTKSFPENSLIAGNPAKLVRTIEQEKCDNDESI